MEDSHASSDYTFLSEIVAQERDLDIRAYTVKIKEELSRLEEECITDFLTINKDVACLFSELNTSSAILNKIENVVDSFQTELGDISVQVSSLQERSQTFNTQLRNRKAVEKEIHGYLTSILIPPSLINDLCNAEIDQEYIDNIQKLNGILHNVRSQEIPDSKALQQVRPELDKLKYKVCSRVRNFLVSKLNTLKKPKTNF